MTRWTADIQTGERKCKSEQRCNALFQTNLAVLALDTSTPARAWFSTAYGPGNAALPLLCTRALGAKIGREARPPLRVQTLSTGR